MFKKLIAALFLVVIIANGTGSVTAQLDPEPIHASNSAMLNMRWSLDSTTFVFQQNLYLDTGGRDFGVHTASMNWYAYDQARHEVTRSDDYPFQPILDTTQKQAMQLAAIEGQESFVFSSPNGRFLAYLAEPPTDWCDGIDVCGRPLAIYDQAVESFQYISYVNMFNSTSYVTSGDISDFEHDFNLVWSANSSTLYGYTLTSGNAPLTFRITGFNTSPLVLTVQMLSDGFQVQNESVAADGILAVSSDGMRFLTGTYGFWLYDFADPSKSKQLADPKVWIISAIFDPQDDNVIWYINKFGLFRRDLTTDQEVLIDASINSNRATNSSPWFQKAVFAPDLSAIALYLNGNAEALNQIQIYRLQPQATPIP
ncbi:MAG: hypothetical protein KF726_04795 [Anaerolineae bacterium]|nr:hypothetical protein [Anaerolineae bacterium]